MLPADASLAHAAHDAEAPAAPTSPHVGPAPAQIQGLSQGGGHRSGLLVSEHLQPDLCWGNHAPPSPHTPMPGGSTLALRVWRLVIATCSDEPCDAPRHAEVGNGSARYASVEGAMPAFIVDYAVEALSAQLG